jgi:hypothetical protein
VGVKEAIAQRERAAAPPLSEADLDAAMERIAGRLAVLEEHAAQAPSPALAELMHDRVETHRRAGKQTAGVYRCPNGASIARGYPNKGPLWKASSAFSCRRLAQQ